MASAETLKSAKHAFRRAERAIKRSERLTGALPTAAINQLRYAGRHLLDVDADATGVAAQKAINHCVRAWYDAFDVILLKQLEAIADFEEAGFPKDAILHYCPDYERHLPLIQRAQALFRGTPPTQSLSVERMIARLHMAKRLVRLVTALRIATQELRKTYLERAEDEAVRQENAQRRQDCVAFSATLAGCFLGILGILMAVDTWQTFLVAVILIALAIGVSIGVFRLLSRP